MGVVDLEMNSAERVEVEPGIPPPSPQESNLYLTLSPSNVHRTGSSGQTYLGTLIVINSVSKRVYLLSSWCSDEHFLRLRGPSRVISRKLYDESTKNASDYKYVVDEIFY